MPSVAGLPSVTEILKDVGLVETYDFLPAKHRTAAQDRGTALHFAIQLWHEGTLDEASLHPLIRPGFEAYREWAEQERWEWRHSELELIHRDWGFCGHLDLVGESPDVGIEILDIKNTDSVNLDDAALQLAGYGILWDQAHNWTGGQGPHIRRRVLQIPKKGTTVKAHDVTSKHSVQVFSAALMVYQEKHRRRTT